MLLGMIYLRLGVMLIVVLVVWLVIKLLRSPKFDRWCNNMVDGKLDIDSNTKDTMKDITTAEKDLSKQAEGNIKEAEKLANESKGINDFLSKKNVVETKKGGG